MSAITLFAMIFSFLLGGGDEKIVDDKGQPVVVAKNEVPLSKPLPVPDLFRYDWTDETFEIGDEWSSTIHLATENYGLFVKEEVYSSVGYRVTLDPPTECQVKFSGKVFTLKSGDHLSEIFRKVGPVNNFGQYSFSLKGSVGQRATISLVTSANFSEEIRDYSDRKKKYDKDRVGKTFSSRALEEKYEPKFKGKSFPMYDPFSSSSGGGLAWSPVIEIPAGYKYEIKLDTGRPLEMIQLKTVSTKTSTQFLGPHFCEGPTLLKGGPFIERTLVFVVCNNHNSKVIVSLTPAPDALGNSVKLASSAGSSKSE